MCIGVLMGSLLDVLELSGALASSAPHHQEDERLIAWTSKHGHRAVCSGVLIGSFVDVLEVETGFEVVQSWAAKQSSAAAM